MATLPTPTPARNRTSIYGHRDEHRDEHRVVDLQIVGAGLAGLIAANEAIDAGLTVRLIEKQRHAGGRAASQVRDGHVLNLGPHALYLGGGLDQALQRLGIETPGAPPALERARGAVGDRDDLLPGSPTSLLRTSLLSPGSKLRLGRLLAGLPKRSTAELAGTSAGEWADTMAAGREDLRALLRGLLTLSTYSGDLDAMSADAAVTNLAMGVSTGVRYIDGGWQSIVDALEARLAQRAGGRLQRVRASVAGIEPSPDGWRCIVSAGPPVTRTADRSSDASPERPINASDVGPAAGADGLVGRTLLVAAGTPAVVDRLTGSTSLAEAAGPAVEASVLDLGLTRPPATRVFMDFTPDEPALYLSDHTRAKGLTPTGGSLVTVARYHRPADDLDHESSKALLLRHAERAGIARADIVLERYLHRVAVTHGMPRAVSGGLAGRPPVDVAGHPGLFVAGDWVGDKGLLADASAHSATRAVAAIVAAGAAGDRDRRATVGTIVGAVG